MSTDNDPRPGRPRTSTDEGIVKMLLKNIVVQHVMNFVEPREQKRSRKIHPNRPQLLVAGPFILHDNSRMHIADVVTKKLRDYD